MASTAERLRALMDERGLRQTDILNQAAPYCARYQVKLGKSDLSQFVNGRVVPGRAKLTVLALALGVSEQWLMGLDVPPERNEDTLLSGVPLSSEAMRVARAYDRADTKSRGIVRAALAELLSSEEAVPDSGAAAEPAPETQSPQLLSFPGTGKKVLHRDDGFDEIGVYNETAAAGLGNYLDAPVSRMEQYPAGTIPPGTDFGVVISGDSMEPRIRDGSTVFVQSRSAIDNGEIGIFVLNGLSYCKKLVVDHEKREVRLRSLNPKYDDIPIGAMDELRTLGKVLGSFY